MAYTGTDIRYAAIIVSDEEIKALPKRSLDLGVWQSNYFIPIQFIEYNPKTGLYKTPVSGWYDADLIIRYMKINACKLLPVGTIKISYDHFMSMPDELLEQIAYEGHSVLTANK